MVYIIVIFIILDKHCNIKEKCSINNNLETNRLLA